MEMLLNFQEVKEVPVDFTDKVMEKIQKVDKQKEKEKYWMLNHYKNIGKGFIAAGILGVLINGWALVGSFTEGYGVNKTFENVDKFTNSYYRVYEDLKVSLNIFRRDRD